ncbi:MAG: hypothetical protein Q7J35_18575, partial [Candidatus Methanoperedens sp.]|nr:hypothetical protein [Candidatus Methanoperedens sp.]
RCAIAGCDVHAGEDVILEMKNGMLIAEKSGTGLRGKVVFSGKNGDDIAVKDVTGSLQQLAGSITIIRVPGITEGGTRVVETEKVRKLLLDIRPHKIGAMGTSAKVLMGRMNLRCDIEFDVIQSGILAAQRGFNVAIFASGGMAERAIIKISEQNIRHSLNII